MIFSQSNMKYIETSSQLTQHHSVSMAQLRRWSGGLVAWPPFVGSTRTLPFSSRIMCQKARRCHEINRGTSGCEGYHMFFFYVLIVCVSSVFRWMCDVCFNCTVSFFMCVWAFIMNHWFTLECIQRVFLCICWHIGHIIVLCMNVQTCLVKCDSGCFYYICGMAH